MTVHHTRSVSFFAALLGSAAALAQVGPACPQGMVAVTAGQVIIGLSASQRQVQAQAVSQSGFCIHTAEVTADDYSACVARGACSGRAFQENCNIVRAGNGRHPMNCVSFIEASRYCQAFGFSLPTEAQWEYAAQSGDPRRYPWGDAPPVSQLCWSGAFEGQREGTCQVGSFAAGRSPLGLDDMAGNVWEFTLNLFLPMGGPQSAGSAQPVSLEMPANLQPDAPLAQARVAVRGGGYGDVSPEFVTVTARIGVAANATHLRRVGFRCVAPLGAR